MGPPKRPKQYQNAQGVLLARRDRTACREGVLIQEIEDELPRTISAGVMNIQSNTSNSFRSNAGNAGSDDPLSFSQIRLRYVIVARFEIE